MYAFYGLPLRNFPEIRSFAFQHIIETNRECGMQSLTNGVPRSMHHVLNHGSLGIHHLPQWQNLSILTMYLALAVLGEPKQLNTRFNPNCD